MLYAGIDATAVDQAPVRGYAPLQGLYFVFWILVAAFVLLDLLIGTLVATYDEIANQDEGVVLMSEQQKSWAVAMEQLIALKPRPLATPPDGHFGRWCFTLIHEPRFESVVLGAILVNTCLLYTSPSPRDS